MEVGLFCAGVNKQQSFAWKSEALKWVASLNREREKFLITSDFEIAKMFGRYHQIAKRFVEDPVQLMWD